MPNCRKCRRPVIFLTARPTHSNPDPRPVPIDPVPNPAGSVAIYQVPNPNSVYPPDRDAPVRFTYYVAMFGELVKMYRQAGGVIYSNHFDTCPG